MQPGGTKDYGFAKITMVHGEQAGTCQAPNGKLMPGGNGVGFIIKIPHHNLTIYHAGITGIFRDMRLINDLYKPDIAIIPIGDDRGMSPAHAAYATKNFLTNAKTIVPAYYTSFPGFKDGTVENFEKALADEGVSDRKILNPKDYLHPGKPIIE